MKRILRFFVLISVLVPPLQGLADTVTFDFSTDEGLKALGIAKPASGKWTELTEPAYTIGSVSMSYTSASTPTRVWNRKGNTELRFYKDGGSITFSVPEGQHITAVVFTGVLQSKANPGKLSGMQWTDNGTNTNLVTFTATATNNIKNVVITYSAVQPEQPVFTVNSIQELKALQSGSRATLCLTDGDEGSMARVLYVHGTGDTQEAYVRDRTGAVCFYGINPNVPFVCNQHMAGKITGEYVLENGVPRFKAVNTLTNTSLLVIAAPITEADVQPKEIKAADYAVNVADWISLKNLRIAADELSAQEGITVRNRFGITADKDKYVAPYAGAIVDIAGIAVPDGDKKEINPLFENNQRPVVFVIDEGEAFVSPQQDMHDVAVRLNRTLTSGHWNTFAVPFDIESESLKDAQIAKFTGKMEGSTMIFENGQTRIEAGTPYLVKWEVKNPTYEGVTLKAINAQTVSSTDQRYSFVATYGPATLALDKTERYLGSDGNLYYPTGAEGQANRLKGLRAYYRVPATAGTKIAFFDETTGIALPKEQSQPCQFKVYNLNGQYLGSSLNGLPKGLYIVNGRKVIIN
ncbi:hypothetical protein PI172_2151 [Prevotella intermedia]|uniref:Uncharacterized protein n=1 Tax=Prevotella intermedia TaxID=28131 RepID=A0AAD1BJM7_PREIN|nr:hypothetical protein [Prevotella intermedia]AFJ07521.1 hypothetical protein PIN17_0062 [Prevotella intermedia 17]APW35328.1 hypothetical protein BWX40_10515 [Prevotella intermedia]BAR96879.1 hypothetical protein PI172_2151 [Prevotella intermedia]